eukprot:jgi/Tetstr1/434793/TSEL_023843.t1
MAFPRLNETITALLVLSVLYQSIQMATYKPRHRIGREETELMQAKYTSGGVTPRDGALPQPPPQPQPERAGSRGGAAKLGRSSRGRGGKVGVAAGRAAVREGGGRGTPRQQGQQQREGERETEGGGGGAGVSIEAISEAEARRYVADMEDVPVGGGGEGGEAEEEGEGAEQGDELPASHPPERPITLGGEPKWHHPMSGQFGGIGWPKDNSEERLYLLNRTHFLLHQHQFEADGQRGGWISANGRPRSAILRYPTLLPSGEQAVEQVGFLAEDLDLLPYNDTRWRFGTCAIISNSGSLLHSRYGNEIDAHDAVMRINHAPVMGFRRFVGIKTTFDICNRPHAKRLSKLSVLRKGQKSSLVLFEALNWTVYYRLYRQLFKLYPFPGTVVLSPDLLIAAMQLWRRLALNFPKDAYSCSAIKRAASQGTDNKRCQYMKHDCESQICKPSSGFFALVFAAQMCNQIDMYGFEAYRFNSQMAKATKYHYFDDETGMTNVHSFVLLMKVFKFLSQRYPIRIRTSEHGSIDLEADEIRRRRLRF